MEIKPYFSGIKELIIDELNHATRQIDIAVAWFTNHEIFEALLAKLPQVRIRLIIINDDVNNRYGGLDLQKFIDSKGEFYFAEHRTPMNNKYCIIDDRVLITGSFNYTYWAESINDENVIKIIGGGDVVNSFKSNFKEILGRSNKVSRIDEYLAQHPFSVNIYSYNNFILKDIYKQSLVWRESGKSTEAEALLRDVEKNSIYGTRFTIGNVIYRQWRESYVAKQIWVDKDEIVIQFETELSDGCYIWGPKMIGTWMIQDSKDKSQFVESYKISDVCINGEEIFSEVKPHTIYHFLAKNRSDEEVFSDYLKKDKNGRLMEVNGKYVAKEKHIYAHNGTLSCNIHFHAPGFSEKTIDLVEGKGSETEENHWHCFEINMKLNRSFWI